MIECLLSPFPFTPYPAPLTPFQSHHYAVLRAQEVFGQNLDGVAGHEPQTPRARKRCDEQNALHQCEAFAETSARAAAEGEV